MALKLLGCCVTVVRHQLHAALLAAGCLGMCLAAGCSAGGSGLGDSADGKSAHSSSKINVDHIRARLDADAPLNVRWAVDLKSCKPVRFILPPQTAKGVGYILVETDKKDLIAIHRLSGNAVWWTRLDGPVTGEPYFSEFGLYFVVNSNVVCLEPHSGDVIWRLEMPFPPGSGPVVVEPKEARPIIYVAGLDRKLYSVEIHKTVWPPRLTSGSVSQRDFKMDKYIPRVSWRQPTVGQLLPAIDISEGKIFASDLSGRVYGVSTSVASLSGKPEDMWTFRGSGAFASGPTRVGYSIYVPSRDRSLYCLDRRDGQMIWRYPSGHLLSTPAYSITDPYVKKTNILLSCGETGPLVMLDQKDGSRIWSLADGKEILARFDDDERPIGERINVVVRNRDGSLSGHIASTGKEVWRSKAAGLGPYCLNASDPFVYGAAGSMIFAIERGK